MSRYESEQVAYRPLKKKNVPIWKIDTNSMTVTHFNTDTQTEENKTYTTDFIRHHLHFFDNHCPDRLRRLVNKGRIIQYLDDMERKDSEAISRQVELRKQTDSCYQKAVLSGDAEKSSVWRIALSTWREKRCLSVWFIFDRLRLCLRVQPYHSVIRYLYNI